MADNAQPKDIYEDVEGALKQQPAPRGSSQLKKSAKRPMPSSSQSVRSSSNNLPRFPVLIVVVLFVIIIALVVVLFFNPFQGTNTANDSLPMLEEESTVLPSTILLPSNLQVVDSDQDGLSDAEEQQAGTDPTTADTDSDGLFDREEVKIYESNPLQADTDNDGELDGIEVTNGTDPAGQGLLRDLQSEIDKLGQ